MDMYNDGYTQKNFTVFNKETIRSRFISKVYSILTAQLLITFSLIGFICYYPKEYTIFINNHVWIMAVAFVLYIFTLFSLACSEKMRNKFPLNYLLLLTFTVCFSLLISNFCIEYKPVDVLISASLTCLISVILTIFAFNTKYDFTVHMQGLISFLFVLIFASIIGIFFRNKIYQLMLSVLIAGLYCVFLLVDTQLLIGKHSNKVDIDDYIFIALNLYIDIMRIFIEILKIIGSKKD